MLTTLFTGGSLDNIVFTPLNASAVYEWYDQLRGINSISREAASQDSSDRADSIRNKFVIQGPFYTCFVSWNNPDEILD